MPALAILLTLAAQNGQTMRDVRVSIVGMVPLAQGQSEIEVLEFKLENRTRKAVTAWEVRLESVQKGDPVAGVSADGYLTYSGLAPSGKYSAVMPPGAFTHGHISVSNDLQEDVRDLRAVLVYAIFDDRTWIGDADSARRVFAFRAGDKEAAEYIAASLRAGLNAAAVGGDAVRVALDHLEAMREDEFASQSKKNNMLGNLQRLLGRRATLTPAQVEATLRARLFEWSRSSDLRNRCQRFRSDHRRSASSLPIHRLGGLQRRPWAPLGGIGKAAPLSGRISLRIVRSRRQDTAATRCAGGL